MRTTGFPLRPALIGVAVLVLLALVAVASRSDRPLRPGDPEARAMPVAFWDYAVTLGVIAMVAVILLAVFLRVPVQAPGGRRFGFSQLIAITIVAALFALAGSRMELPEQLGGEGVSDVVQKGEGQERVGQTENSSSGRDSRAVRFQWPVLFTAGGLALLGLAAFFALRRFSARGLPHADAATALSAVLDDSVEDLRGERDARRAVIAAYARMERTLDRYGLPRRPFEAPLEYLGRVLQELRVRTGAVLALTELFERAKFSRHEIDAEMKEEAIGALIAVRNDLRAEA